MTSCFGIRGLNEQPERNHKTEGDPLSERRTVLIVDDDVEIREALETYIDGSGYNVETAASAEAARSYLVNNTADIVVLDIIMPREDGLSLCRHLHEVTETPIIFLTALTNDTDKIVGLEVGANDYLTKPFNPRELVARIRSVLRRSQSETVVSEPDTRVRFSGWALDDVQSEVERDDGLIVPLTTGELGVLKVFVDHLDEVISRDDLMLLSRGRSMIAFERTMDNLIARLRKKLEADPRNPRIIKTIRGGGYKLISGQVK